jgi:hypothetical protein
VKPLGASARARLAEVGVRRNRIQTPNGRTLAVMRIVREASEYEAILITLQKFRWRHYSSSAGRPLEELAEMLTVASDWEVYPGCCRRRENRTIFRRQDDGGGDIRRSSASATTFVLASR